MEWMFSRRSLSVRTSAASPFFAAVEKASEWIFFACAVLSNDIIIPRLSFSSSIPSRVSLSLLSREVIEAIYSLNHTNAFHNISVGFFACWQLRLSPFRSHIVSLTRSSFLPISELSSPSIHHFAFLALCRGLINRPAERKVFLFVRTSRVWWWWEGKFLKWWMVCEMREMERFLRVGE